MYSPTFSWSSLRRLVYRRRFYVFVLAAVAAVVVPLLEACRVSADRMTYCTKKLQATAGAAIEARQTRFNSLVVEHVRLLLRPTDVQAVAKAATSFS